MHIYNLRWLAKLNFKVLKNNWGISLFVTMPIAILTIIINQKEEVDYEFRELRQFGKFLTQVPHLSCIPTRVSHPFVSHVHHVYHSQFGMFFTQVSATFIYSNTCSPSSGIVIRMTIINPSKKFFMLNLTQVSAISSYQSLSFIISDQGHQFHPNSHRNFHHEEQYAHPAAWH